MSRRCPGNGSATLLDMLSNLFYFSLFLARGGEHGKREEESERARGVDAEGDAERRTLLHLPATLRTRRRHFPISRQASAPVLVHPLLFLPLAPSFPLTLVPPVFLSFRLASSLLSREGRESGSEARNEKKGRKESRWAARVVKKVEEKRKSEEPRLASAATREPSKVE